jgi:hypothetical protein
VSASVCVCVCLSPSLSSRVCVWCLLMRYHFSKKKKKPGLPKRRPADAVSVKRRPAAAVSAEATAALTKRLLDRRSGKALRAGPTAVDAVVVAALVASAGAPLASAPTCVSCPLSALVVVPASRQSRVCVLPDRVSAPCPAFAPVRASRVSAPLARRSSPPSPPPFWEVFHAESPSPPPPPPPQRAKRGRGTTCRLCKLVTCDCFGPPVAPYGRSSMPKPGRKPCHKVHQYCQCGRCY